MNPNAVNLDELYRQYGEATVQLKIANNKVMVLEQQIQQALGSQAQATQPPKP